MKESFPRITKTEKKPQFAKIDQVWIEGFENIEKMKAKSGIIVLGTEVGGRTRNEDRAFLNIERDFFGVVDGIGGHPNGDIAAQLIAENLINAINQGFTPDKIPATEEFLLKRNPGIAYNSGACYLAAQIEKKKLHTWCAGDCRLIVVDDKGKIKFETAPTDLHRAAIGFHTTAGHPEYTIFSNLMNYDRIYVFTDGVTDNLFTLEKTIQDLKSTKIEFAIKELVEIAKKGMQEKNIHGNYGNPDNLTILVYEILPVPLRGK